MAVLYKFVRHLLKYEAGISEDFDYPAKEEQILKPLFEGFRNLVLMNDYGIPSREYVLKTQELVDYAIKKGVSNHKNDPGGLTICGITKDTWNKACSLGCFIGQKDVKFENMTSVQWFQIVRRLYWDHWEADKIVSQELAEQVVDFYFHSGMSATRQIQKLLHVTPDGLIGPKTLEALKYANSHQLCSQIKRARLDFLLKLSRKDKYGAFAYGWLRRLVDW